MSRSFRTLGIAVPILLAAGTLAFASDASTFARLLAKVAPPITGKFKPRVACACPPANGIMRAGYLTSDPISTNIYCAEPNFDAGGTLASDDFCTDWIVLGH
jgi:hypothetical protein